MLNLYQHCTIQYGFIQHWFFNGVRSNCEGYHCCMIQAFSQYGIHTPLYDSTFDFNIVQIQFNIVKIKFMQCWSTLYESMDLYNVDFQHCTNQQCTMQTLYDSSLSQLCTYSWIRTTEFSMLYKSAVYNATLYVRYMVWRQGDLK